MVEVDDVTSGGENQSSEEKISSVRIVPMSSQANDTTTASAGPLSKEGYDTRYSIDSLNQQLDDDVRISSRKKIIKPIETINTGDKSTTESGVGLRKDDQSSSLSEEEAPNSSKNSEAIKDITKQSYTGVQDTKLETSKAVDVISEDTISESSDLLDKNVELEHKKSKKKNEHDEDKEKKETLQKVEELIASKKYFIEISSPRNKIMKFVLLISVAVLAVVVSFVLLPAIM